MRCDISADEARRILKYEPDTGDLRWRVDRTGSAKKGSVAGFARGRGYRGISINNVVYEAHRIAWLIHYGEWPNGQIDHVNGVKDDNRIENLRDVCQSLNIQNQWVAKTNNKSTGIRGVKFAQGKFEAKIVVNGKHIYLGRFDSPEIARAAYASARAVFHPGYVTGKEDKT